MVMVDNPLGLDPMDFNDSTAADRVGRRIKEIRDSIGMTQAELGEKMQAAFKAYDEEVKAGTFSDEAHSFKIDDAVMEQLAGYEKANDWVELRVKVPERVPDKFAKITEMVRKRYGLRVHKFTRKELIAEGWGKRIFDLLNETYKDLYGFSQLSDYQINQLVNDYIKIADLNLVTGVMDGDKLVGFGITFPSFSRALQKTHDGRYLPFGWWHLLKILKWHKTDTVDLLLIGVLPEYRSKGANALIFDDLIRQFQAYGFDWAETGPQMESNEGVLSQWQYLESVPHRRHRCYRKDL